MQVCMRFLLPSAFAEHFELHVQEEAVELWTGSQLLDRSRELAAWSADTVPYTHKVRGMFGTVVFSYHFNQIIHNLFYMFFSYQM